MVADTALADFPRMTLFDKALAAPLAFKLAGANAIMLAITAGAIIVACQRGGSTIAALITAGGAVVVAALVNARLVRLALAPLRQMETTLEQVEKNDLSARVPQDRLMDRDMRRMSGTLNDLIAQLERQQGERWQRTARVLDAGDLLLAGVARDLHDSTAQSLAAVLFELRAAIGVADFDRAKSLERIHAIARGALDDVGMLAHGVRPRALDELSLAEAVSRLARDFADANHIEVVVSVEGVDDLIRPGARSLLYRVAQAGLGRALGPPAARTVSLSLSRLPHGVELSLVGTRDGPLAHRAMDDAMALERDRLELFAGQLRIESLDAQRDRLVAFLPVLNSSIPTIH